MYSSSDTMRVGSGVLHQAVGDDLVLLNSSTQEYYTLDAVGAEMWRVLLQEGSVDAAVRLLEQTYDAPEEKIRRDLSLLVEKLLAAQLLISAPQNGG